MEGDTIVRRGIIPYGPWYGVPALFVDAEDLDTLEGEEALSNFGDQLYGGFGSMKAYSPILYVQGVPSKAENFVVLAALLGKLGVRVVIEINFEAPIPMITLPNVAIQMVRTNPGFTQFEPIGVEGSNLVAFIQYYYFPNHLPSVPKSVGAYLYIPKGSKYTLDSMVLADRPWIMQGAL